LRRSQPFWKTVETDLLPGTVGAVAAPSFSDSLDEKR
jgi:hypothetical protein